MSCPWVVFELSLGCVWVVFGLSLGCLWVVCGLSVGVSVAMSMGMFQMSMFSIVAVLHFQLVFCNCGQYSRSTT